MCISSNTTRVQGMWSMWIQDSN